MLRRLLWALCFLLMLATGFYLLTSQDEDESPKTPPRTNGTSSMADGPQQALPEVTPEENDNLSLALKSIELTQGEGGFEIWRLKAEWANMEKEGDLILVDKPKLIYFMREDNSELHVVSDKGDVNQKAHLLRFMNNVTIRQNANTAVGDLLIYNGTAKTMTFPHGGVFAGEGVEGNAPLVVWRMEDQVIEGHGGVEMLFENSPAKLGGKSASPAP